jgi:predicted nucleic acid-binding protein
MMKPAPAPAVIAWLNAPPAEPLLLSSVTVAEVLYGLRALPEGRRRTDLRARFDRLLAEAFPHHVLDFDAAAAGHYAELMADRRSEGRPMAALEGQIAAIARREQLAIATRNVRDFEGCGLTVFDPFRAPG